jgi:hypothetical protein
MFRQSIFSAISLLLIVLFSSCRHDAELPPIIAGVGDSICFDKQVLPIILSNCAMSGCHDGNGEKFALMNYEEVREKVTPGDPNKSEIYKAITASQLSGSIMPPSSYPRLNNDQVTLIQLWIMEGAHNNSCVNYCDSIHVTFSGTIHSILQNNCTSCHSGADPSAALALTTYEEVKSAMINKSVLQHLQEADGYSLMPPTGQLSTCNIAQFNKWIHDGLPNN